MILLEDTIKEIKKSLGVKEESAIVLSKKEKLRLYNKQYILDNKEKISEQKKQYYLANKEKISKERKQYHLDNRESRILYNRQYRLDNREQISEYKKEYELANREKIYSYKKQKRDTDPLFRLTHLLRNRLREALKGNSKSASTMKLLGCSIEFLKQHLEKQFKPGMSWENRSSFHVDHIRPCASFDLIKPEEQRKCFNYTNLQPLFPIDNMRKGARY